MTPTSAEQDDCPSLTITTDDLACIKDGLSSPISLIPGHTPRVAAIILATPSNHDKMKSTLPTPLHPLADLPLLAHAIRLALKIKAEPIIIITHLSQYEEIKSAMNLLFGDYHFLLFPSIDNPSTPVDGLRSGLSLLPLTCTHVLVLSSIMPLITAETMHKMSEASEIAPFVILGEEEDLSGTTCKDVIFAEKIFLMTSLKFGHIMIPDAKDHNELMDLIITACQKDRVATVPVSTPDELLKIHTRVDLAEAERILRSRLIPQHQLAGVTFTDPLRVILGTDIILDQDVTIGADVQILGKTHIHHSNTILGPTFIRDTIIEPYSHIREFSHLDGAHISSHCIVGPYARLRLNTHLAPKVMIGNFVEIKNTTMGEGAKANHLAFVGDADIGPESNLGAGTVTCNFDSVDKHRTRVGRGVFMGSNSTLIAPVSIEDGAFVAAGSVITDDVGEDALAFGRARQVIKKGGAIALRERLRAAEAAKDETLQGQSKEGDTETG